MSEDLVEAEGFGVFASKDVVSDSAANAPQTYWNKTRYSTYGPPWTLKAENGRGMVAYSNYAFKAGDLICTECPTVWIYGHHPFNEAQMNEIDQKVSALCEEDKAAFFAMENVFVEEFPPAIGIFMTNCFDMTDSIYGTTCAMYLALARLNHSCIPNAQQTHIPTTTEEVLYAARDIAIGEEINDCYIDLRQDRQQRCKELSEYYRFLCQCPACSVDNESSLQRDDILRKEAFDFNDRLVALVESDIDAAEEYGIRVLGLLEKSENLTWSARYLSEVYISLYQLCNSLSKKRSSGKYLVKAYNITTQLEGDRSPEAVKLKAWLDEFFAKQSKKKNLTIKMK